MRIEDATGEHGVPMTEHTLTFDGEEVTLDLGDNSTRFFKALTTQDGSAPDLLRALAALVESSAPTSAAELAVPKSGEPAGDESLTLVPPQRPAQAESGEPANDPPPPPFVLDEATRKAIREWATEQGIKLTPRLSTDVIDRWKKAHGIK